MSAPLFPALTFLVVAALNFSTGSVWGIPAIVVPIIMPLAFSIGANPLVVMGAVVSGATLGSHACFYSDATVLTSSCCNMENRTMRCLSSPMRCWPPVFLWPDIWLVDSFCVY